MFQLRFYILSALLSCTNLCQIEISTDLTIQVMKQLNKHQKDILIITHGLSHVTRNQLSKRLSLDGFEFRFAKNLKLTSSQSFVILDESATATLISRLSLVQYGLIWVKNRTRFDTDLLIDINQEIYFYDQCHQRIYEKYSIGRTPRSPSFSPMYLQTVKSNLKFHPNWKDGLISSVIHWKHWPSSMIWKMNMTKMQRKHLMRQNSWTLPNS